jgi:hypothetical protein
MCNCTNKILNMAKLKVNITELKKIIKRAVKEAKVVPTGGSTLHPMYKKPLYTLFEFFGEGDSGFDLYEPSSENRDLEYINDMIEDNEDNEEYVKNLEQIISLIKKYPNGKKFVSNNIFDSSESFPCPGAPKNSFQECVQIDENEISLFIPYPDSKGQYSVGWFDVTGEYHPDTKNFDEDGNYIGGNA